jgi:hypothetical protein
MLMLNLANFNQFEREMISERTRDALQHMKVQRVRLGHAPYGYEHINQLDDRGRRLLVPLASEQQVIARMAEAHAAGVGTNGIARQLNAEGIRARRGGDWCRRMVSVVLQLDRAGFAWRAWQLSAAKRSFQLGGDVEVDVEVLVVADPGFCGHKQIGQVAYRGGALKQLLMEARCDDDPLDANLMRLSGGLQRQQIFANRSPVDLQVA